jgi:predicted N-acetyltransferase YhbS
MIRVERASPRHAAGIVALMTEASRGCFCRYWHYPGDDRAWQARSNLSPADNRLELERALEDGSDPTLCLVACDADAIVGWLKLCEAEALDKLQRRRLYRDLECLRGDRRRVYVVGCLLVAPTRRRQGVARALCAAAVEAAASAGAVALEALPRRSDEPLRDDELWTGPAQCFEELGFEHRGGPRTYPVMRRDFGPDEPLP